MARTGDVDVRAAVAGYYLRLYLRLTYLPLSGRSTKVGDEVTLSYKVLKLGKRSYDGLSGEGTVVFSRGYGLEDDEKKPGDKAFITTLGSPINIIALNEAVNGMQPGGVRRLAVLPPKGWRKPGAACDGGPGGQGAGGELRTDYGKLDDFADDYRSVIFCHYVTYLLVSYN